MRVGSDLKKEEIWKVSAAVVMFLKIQLCASGAEAKRERWWTKALLLETATRGRTRDLAYPAELQQNLVIGVPCSFATVSWEVLHCIFPCLKLSVHLEDFKALLNTGLPWAVFDLFLYKLSWVSTAWICCLVDHSSFGLKIGLATVSNFTL